jgi:YtcA family
MDEYPEMSRNHNTPRLYAVTASSALFAAAGCSRAPTINVLGSFFPAWILCGLIGIVVTAIVRVLFVRWNFEKYLTPLLVVYPCLAAFITFTCWLLFYS